MTDAGQAARNLQINPHDLHISAMAIFHRAALGGVGAEARQALMTAMEDYLWYGRRCFAEMGVAAPYDDDTLTQSGPVATLFEAGEFVGLSQRMAPPMGKDQFHVRLVHRGEQEASRYGPTPATAKAAAVAELAQHPDGRWQFLHVEVSEDSRRQGLATLLYDRLADTLRAELQPSGWLTEDAYAFWRARGHPFLKHYRQVEHIPAIWISPAALLTLMRIAETQLEGLEEL